jgi:hypothetical protein
VETTNAIWANFVANNAGYNYMRLRRPSSNNALGFIGGGGGGSISEGSVNTLGIRSEENIYFASQGNTTRMVISGSTGNVGIGTTTPSQKLTINGNVSVTGSIISDGNLTLTSGDIFLTGNLKFGQSGQGIDFSATGNGTLGVSGSLGGELLNDYEEGTFTPELSGSTIAGTWSYGYNQGFYTKIGDTVIINGAIDINNTVGSTGQLIMKGFPFTSRSNNVGIYPFTVSWNGFATAIDRLIFQLSTNAVQGGLTYSIGAVTNAENTNLSGSNIGSGRIRFSGVYKTNS